MNGFSAAYVLLTEDPLNPQDAVRAVLSDADGAFVLFTGVVRNHSKGRNVDGIEYQAYIPMAEAQMRRIAEQVEARWGLGCAILHRFGYLRVGEASVVVCVAGPHRAETFDACRWVIDTLKSDVPIWKKEFAEDGTYWIEGDDALPASDN